MEITELTNEIVRDVVSDYDKDYYVDSSNLIDISGQQERPWLLVESKPDSREVWFTMHRSLDTVKWTVAESMWEGMWRPEMVYNTKSGGCHEVSIEVHVEQ